MGLFDIFTPTPPLDEAEHLRLQTTPRYRYALRVAGWSSRTVAAVGALTWIGRLIAEPAARAPGAIAVFAVKWLAVVSIVAVLSFSVSAFTYPAMRRRAERLEKSS